MLRITLLTAPPAAGKNTIAHLYATQFSDLCAVIDTDLVRWMLRNPHVAPFPPHNPEPMGIYQHYLGIKHSCMLAESFIEESFEVVICDVVGDTLAAYYQYWLDTYDFRIVLLLPTWEEVLKRLNNRPPTVTEDEARALYRQQTRLTTYDIKIDNTSLSAEAVARRLAES